MASHGGDYFGLDGDGLTYVDSSVSSVFDLLDTKSISWAEYQEGNKKKRLKKQIWSC